MDYETDQHKWKSQLTAALENYPMGNNSLDKWGYWILEWDESQTLTGNQEKQTENFKLSVNICNFFILVSYLS